MQARIAVMAAAVALSLGATAAAPDAPVVWTSSEIKWSDLAEPAGARQSPLWKDSATGDTGTLVRWKFNTKVPARTAETDTHVVILAGTFLLAVEGTAEKQLGPGAFASIPRGSKYESGCEAAGECVFVMHQAGSAR